MYKLISFLSLAILLVSCNNYNYTITGDVPVADFEGKTIRLFINDSQSNRVVLNESVIKKGKYTMKGNTDSSFVATLMIVLDELPYILPVAVEQGQIYVKMGYTTNVRGTELNDKLQDFMLAKDAFVDANSDDSQSNMPLFNQFIQEQIQLYSNNYPQLSRYIRDHYLR